jgi:hypothetical protein
VRGAPGGAGGVLYQRVIRRYSLGYARSRLFPEHRAGWTGHPAAAVEAAQRNAVNI